MIIYTNGLGHMTKIGATPIYGKKVFINSFLQNQWADCNETCYVAFGMWAHHSLWFIQVMTIA